MAKKAANKARSAAAPRAEAEQPVLEGVVIPDGAKLPQDHKPKQDKKSGARTVSVRGEDWSIDEDALDDFELLDDINALEQRDDVSRMPSVLRRLLGDDQWKKAMDVCRDKDSGRVTVEAGTEFVFDIMRELNPNSSGS